MLTDLNRVNDWLRNAAVGSELVFFDFGNFSQALTTNHAFKAVYNHLTDCEATRKIYLAMDNQGRYVATKLA